MGPFRGPLSNNVPMSLKAPRHVYVASDPADVTPRVASVISDAKHTVTVLMFVLPAGCVLRPH